MIEDERILATLEEIGVLLELLGENPFKAKAYATAVRALSKCGETIPELVASGRLGEVPGIGNAIADKVTVLVRTGHLEYHDQLRSQVPPGLFEVLRVPGLGPKKVRKLWTELGISSLAELEYACTENRLLTLEGFGTKSQDKVLGGVRFLRANAGRRLLSEVMGAAEALAVTVGRLPGVAEAKVAGEIRRHLPVIGRLDLVVATTLTAAELVERLTDTGAFEDLAATTPGRISGRWVSGLATEFRIAPPEALGAALLLATGSEGCLDRIRAVASARGLSLDSDGLRDSGRLLPSGDETAVFAGLGLSWIPPELREGRDETARAATGPLPRLVEARDLRGALHLHTTRSDGSADLRTMAIQARELGFSYLGVTDHSKTAVYASGLTLDALEEQRREIEELDREGLGIRILHGIESDILPDGSLDYPDEVLARFDFVIGSVHSSMGMPAEEMTARLLRAVANPWLDIMGHPTGRILLGRPSFAVDLPEVLAAAAREGVVMELNASPSRLDLDWSVLPDFLEQGGRIAIDPDAHSPDGLSDVEWGVLSARKAGSRAEQVVNCLDADGFLAGLRRNRS